MLALNDPFEVIADVLFTNDVYNESGVAEQIVDRLDDCGYVIVQANTKKLLPADVREIRTKHKLGASQADLAHMYRVNPATISRIVRGQYW